MIYEALGLGIDIKKLRTHLETAVFSFPIATPGANFGGWSVQSATGKYTDGWTDYSQFFREINGKQAFDTEAARNAGWVPGHLHVKPTEICSGYLSEVMQKITELGFGPNRARVSVLKARSVSSWHRDGAPENRAVRLHIPIVTNPGRRFACEEGEVHLPADGRGYLLKVNRLHRITNDSDEDRYHLMMNVTDPGPASRW